MIKNISSVQSFDRSAGRNPQPVIRFISSGGLFVVAVAVMVFLPLSVSAQDVKSKDSPVVVQPGSPGQPSKILPSSTRAKLTQHSPKDVEFMQGMIMHHAQAVEMVALMEARTKNSTLLLLGQRIGHTQADEMNLMKRWLISRGEKTSMPMMDMKDMNMSGMDMKGTSDKKEMSDMKNMNMSAEKEKSDMKKMDGMDMKNMDMSDHKHHTMMLMPGMLSAKQMENLAKAKDTEFDRLFLTGMIQHHNGALVMVNELFETTGAGQDAEMFNFATDVDSSQRAEIRIMQEMLGGKPQKEKK